MDGAPSVNPGDEGFDTLRRNIIANTTCDCRACANVGGLDLKVLAHHGVFEEIEIGPMKDMSAADVILVHCMAKTDVKTVTGIHGDRQLPRCKSGHLSRSIG